MSYIPAFGGWIIGMANALVVVVCLDAAVRTVRGQWRVHRVVKTSWVESSSDIADAVNSEAGDVVVAMRDDDVVVMNRTTGDVFYLRLERHDRDCDAYSRHVADSTWRM